MKKIFRISFAVASFAVLACAALSACGLVGEGTWMYSLCNTLGIGGGVALAMAAGVTPSNETIVKDGVEVGDISTSKPSYLADDFDKRLIKIRPTDFPIDTITREVGNTLPAKQMKVNGFEIGNRDHIDEVQEAVNQGSASAAVTIQVGKPGMWLPGDTLILGEGDILDDENKPIQLLVTELGGDGTSIKAKLASDNATLAKKVPAIEAHTKIVRTSSAVTERQAQIDPWNSLPGDYENYCQIHMAQVEETVIHALVDKNTDYNFNAMRDQRLYDFKMSMERANILGKKGVTYDKNNKPVYTSDGLFAQIDQAISWDKSASMSDATFVSFGRQVFENNNGSDERVFIAGNGVLEYLASNAQYQKQLAARQPEYVFGIKFNRITTPFGDLLIKPMGSLFTGGWADMGLVVDPQYLVRRPLEKLQATNLNLNETGQARVNAVRILETYCLMVQNKPVHFRVMLGNGDSSSSI